MTDATIEATIIDHERTALVRWGHGDPDGFLELCADDVVYFDPFVPLRIDGKVALTTYYEGIRGNPQYDRFELLNPVVQVADTMAALSFNFVSYSTGGEGYWNCTEIYRLTDGKWQIIQTHWSRTVKAG